MPSNKKVITEELEEVINRLEEARNEAIDMRESGAVGGLGDEADVEYSENIERIEAAIFETGTLVDELVQVIGEEVENLRSVVEKVDDLVV